MKLVSHSVEQYGQTDECHVTCRYRSVCKMITEAYSNCDRCFLVDWQQVAALPPPADTMFSPVTLNNAPNYRANGLR